MVREWGSAIPFHPSRDCAFPSILGKRVPFPTRPSRTWLCVYIEVCVCVMSFCLSSFVDSFPSYRVRVANFQPHLTKTSEVLCRIFLSRLFFFYFMPAHHLLSYHRAASYRPVLLDRSRSHTRTMRYPRLSQIPLASEGRVKRKISIVPSDEPNNLLVTRAPHTTSKRYMIFFAQFATVRARALGTHHTAGWFNTVMVLGCESHAWPAPKAGRWSSPPFQKRRCAKQRR